MFLISFDIKYSLQLDKQDQGFIKALTYIYRRSKLNLELSFETQSYKPQNKKVIKLFRLHGESLIYFFTFKSNQQCKKSVKKEKSQSREQNMYAWQTSFCAIYVFWIKFQCQFSKTSTFGTRLSTLFFVILESSFFSVAYLTAANLAWLGISLSSMLGLS